MNLLWWLIPSKIDIDLTEDADKQAAIDAKRKHIAHVDSRVRYFTDLEVKYDLLSEEQVNAQEEWARNTLLAMELGTVGRAEIDRRRKIATVELVMGLDLTVEYHLHVRTNKHVDHKGLLYPHSRHMYY